ncbi:SPOR domain-containing protein [Marinifilum sp. D737]|jgi:cell division septation protein DedD|uniref:SPOR domain-containing protein n=1 Tax=Marinifilum sp. D737 TaxID=2969628 RepID=UPI0022759B28|nr:SPOR domain-containing protein [Marinifilum sp. D737]MCY1636686.1 SPOR domain-containing protein [Marinifilum sp. D737]
MNYLSKILLLSVLICGIGLSSCKEEAKEPVKKETTKKVAKKKEVKKPTAKPVEKKKLEPVVEKVPNKYFLIVASFENKTNAEKLKSKLKKEGYISDIHNAKNGFFRVSYKAFSDRKLAFQELASVRSTEEHKDTWLYIKR